MLGHSPLSERALSSSTSIYSESVSQSITVSDTATYSQVHSESVSQTITLSHSAVVPTIYNRSLVQSFTSSHTVANSIPYHRSIIDTVVLTHEAKSSDRVTNDLVLYQIVSERLLQHQILHQSLTFIQSITGVVHTLIPEISQSINFTQSVVRNNFYYDTIAQNLSITQTVNQQFHELQQTLTITQTVKQSIILELVTQELTVSQVALATIPQYFSINEFLTLTDSVRSNIQRHTLSQTLTLSQSVIGRNIVIRESITESFNPVQTLLANIVLTVSPCSNLSIHHSVARTFTESVSQTLTITHEALHEGNILHILTISQTIATNAVQRACSFDYYVPNKALDQTLTITDAVLTTGTTGSKSLSHSLSLIDSTLYLVA